MPIVYSLALAAILALLYDLWLRHKRLPALLRAELAKLDVRLAAALVRPDGIVKSDVHAICSKCRHFVARFTVNGDQIICENCLTNR